MPQPTKHPISPEDSALFRQAFAALPRQLVIPPSDAPPAATRRDQAHTPRTRAAAPPMREQHSADGNVLVCRDGVQKKTRQRLQRGKIPPQDKLDLHGQTADQAHQALADFIDECRAQHFTCALIIHGKGLNSAQPGGVLPALTQAYLSDHPEILAFCQAQPRDGGRGAVYVLLKKGI